MRRRAQKGASYERELRRVEPIVMDRADWRCELMIPGQCDGLGLTMHHRKLRSQGGSNETSNLIACCAGCHHYIHLKPEHSYHMGWLVKGFADPAKTEIRTYRRDQ